MSTSDTPRADAAMFHCEDDCGNMESHVRVDFARTLKRELAEAKVEEEGSHALIMRQAELLSKAAIALRGPEPELTKWSHHDVPELIDALRAKLTATEKERDEARKARKQFGLDEAQALAERDAALAEVARLREALAASIEGLQDSRCRCDREPEGDDCEWCKMRQAALTGARTALNPSPHSGQGNNSRGEG